MRFVWLTDWLFSCEHILGDADSLRREFVWLNLDTIRSVESQLLTDVCLIIFCFLVSEKIIDADRSVPMVRLILTVVTQTFKRGNLVAKDKGLMAVPRYRTRYHSTSINTNINTNSSIRIRIIPTNSNRNNSYDFFYIISLIKLLIFKILSHQKCFRIIVQQTNKTSIIGQV